MLENALIYLCAAVIAVPVAKRLGLGSVLGYLIAGLLIGPYMLSLVGDQQDVMHFAEFGVVMMLFLIGLELQPSKLWQLRKSILGLGGSQVVLTAVLIGAVLMLLTDYSWQSSTAVALALALSSTAIVLQSLQEKGLLKTQTGQNAFSVLLFQDIAVIPILALLPLLATGAAGQGSDGHGHSLIGDLATHWQVLITLAVIIGIVLGGRFIASPIFRFVADSGIKEIFTALSLLIVVAITVLMTALGLSPALGAFIAGVVLADNEFRLELELDIEPFKGLLLGLFFITVGAGINIPLIADEPGLILTGVVGLIALKALVLAGLAKVFRFSRYQAGIFTVALAQGGEFAFVLLSMSGTLGIIDTNLNNLVIAVVAISMFVSPLLLMAYEHFASQSSQATAPEADVIEQEGDIIIAGYGRFGQLVGRLLTSQGHKLTILDHSPGQIELLRRFGHKVFYGDAAKAELLEAAGANDARLLIIAVDEVDKSMDIVNVAQTHFPHLKLLVRAIDRPHAYKLAQHKVAGQRRETFDAAINLGVQALTALGYDSPAAERAGKLFLDHDEASITALADAWEDQTTYHLAIHQHFEELQRVLEADQQQPKETTVNTTVEKGQ